MGVIVFPRILGGFQSVTICFLRDFGGCQSVAIVAMCGVFFFFSEVATVDGCLQAQFL